MAPAHSTIFSLLSPSNNPITNTPQTHPLLLTSSIPTSYPPKSKSKSKVKYKRKNHLRPKILKFLTTPHLHITHLPPQESPLSTPLTTEVELEDNRIEVPIDELEESSVSEMIGSSGDFNGGVVGKISAKSVLKYGVVLFGAFVLQTIFSAMVMLNDELKKKDGDFNGNVGEKESFLFDGGGKTMGVNGGSGVISLMDQLGMDKKIEEIKVMAREVRRIEGLKKEGEEIEDIESDDESAVFGDRLGIEKGIVARLLNLQDRVDSDRDKTALLNVIRNLGASVKSSGGVVKENKNADKGNGSLMFKKKLKFKSPSTKQRKAPKGFPGTRDYKASDAETRDSSSEDKAKVQENRSTADANHVQILHEDKLVNQRDFGAQEADSKLSLEDEGTLTDGEANTLQDTGKNLEEPMARPDEGTGMQVENNRGSNGNDLLNHK